MGRGLHLDGYSRVRTSPGEKKERIVGVPEKGRNAGIALREELTRDDTEEILDILNGRGKEAAKTGEDFTEIWKEAKNYDFIRLKDTGRAFPRPIFTEIRVSDKTIRSYKESPTKDNFDRFYQSFDQMIEENCSPEEITRDFEDLARDVASREGYELEKIFGDEVKWAAMNNCLEAEPETVLLPEDFPSLGQAVVYSYWDIQPDYTTFQDYAKENGFSGMDEEELISETPTEVAGIYVFVSGGTADDQDLEYEAVPGFTSQLGLFQNRYKNSVENRS